MNILYTAYYGLGIGGAEVSMSLLANAMKKRHNITIASTQDYSGFKTYKFNKYIKYIPNFYVQNRCMQRFFSSIIKKENIQIIHSHDSKTAVAAIMAAKNTCIKSVTHYRDYWFCCPKSSLLTPDLTNCDYCKKTELKKCFHNPRYLWNLHKLAYLTNVTSTLNMADKKIAISNAVKEKLNMAGLNGAEIVPNGIDIGTFKNRKNHHELTLGYIGSLNYNKGLQNIIGVIKKFLNKHKNSRLVIVGDGDLKQWLNKEFFDFKSRAIFKGKLGYHETINAYNEFDIVLIPSVWQEPFSRAAIEAMAAGKPIIASDVGGLKDIIKDDFGILVNANDYCAWENAIELLATKPIKRRLMGINAQKESKKYNIDLIAERVNKLYAEIA